MRIVMLGTGPFAVPTLRALAGGAHDVLLVVTRPPRGRKPNEQSPVGRAALELGLELWSPQTVNAEAAQARIRDLQPDLLVVCDYGEILRPATLAATRLGGVNLHGSLLPKYRGAAPVAWAILAGEQETGNSVIQMTPGLDAGPCLAQDVTPIGPDETTADVEERLANMGAEIVSQVVDQLAAGNARPIPQDASLASKAPRLKKEDGCIDWSAPAAAIHNLVRAMIPWPRAFTYWHHPQHGPQRLNIDRVREVPREEPCEATEEPGGSAQADVWYAVPGTVLRVDGRLWIACGDGAVEIEQLQPAGKRSMTAEEFLRGSPIKPGERLGSG